MRARDRGEGYLGGGLLLRDLRIPDHDITAARAEPDRLDLAEAVLSPAAARIFPVYYLVLSIYLALVLLAHIHTLDGREFLHNLPAFATYTSNWFGIGGDHATFYFAWSLAPEEQFYLLWPPLLVACLCFGIAAARPAAKHWLVYPLGFSVRSSCWTSSPPATVGGSSRRSRPRSCSVPWRPS